MGLWSKFKDMRDGRRAKRLQKAIEMSKNSRAIKEERMAALEFLASIDDPEVIIPALLKRFDFSLEHGIQDEREKAVAMQGILDFENKAVDLVKSHLSHSSRIAWPVKILEKLVSETDLVDALKGALVFDDTSFDDSKIDKNYDLLCYLRDYKMQGYSEKLSYFLNDPDERIRFAAIECLVEQDDAGIPDMIEKFIPDDSSENIRIREKVVQAFVDKGWRIKDTTPYLDGFVMPGIKVTKQGELKQSR